MRILHIISSINTGGAEKFCIDLSNTQAENSEHEVFLVILDKIENQPLLKIISPKVKLISLNKKSGYSLSTPFKIYRLFNKIEPDIIHFNGRDIIYSSIATIIKGIPSIYTVHSHVNLLSNKLIKFNSFLFNYFPSLFMPISISNYVKESTQNSYGDKFNRVIYNGSTEESISPKRESISSFINTIKKDKNSLVFVYVGRIMEIKNTLLLIKAFNKLLDEGENISLCIVGYDVSKSQSYLKKCKKENRHPSYIKFVGQQRNVVDYFSCADASCITSNQEGLGITVLESLSMGTPVLATPCGGPEEIIEPKITGVISEEISVDSYIKILKDFIKNPIINRAKIIDIYRQNYTMKITSKKYLEIYNTRLKSNSNL
jgi:glycosyltransferase involved in cell wall biosynthesis